MRAVVLLVVTLLANAGVVNTGEDVAIVVTVVFAELRGIGIDKAGSGEFRCENGPDDAAEDIGMGCSLSMLIKAALPDVFGTCVFAGGGC